MLEQSDDRSEDGDVAEALAVTDSGELIINGEQGEGEES